MNSLLFPEMNTGDSKTLQGQSLDQGCQTQFLEGRSPAKFSSNPN